MEKRRIARLNSLLREVLAEVILREVKNPLVSRLCSVSSVDISNDLRHAKVHVSVLGPERDRIQTVKALQDASGFIGSSAAKQVVIRYFPTLTFKLDTSVDKQLRIETILQKIEDERVT